MNSSSSTAKCRDILSENKENEIKEENSYDFHVSKKFKTDTTERQQIRLNIIEEFHKRHLKVPTDVIGKTVLIYAINFRFYLKKIYIVSCK